MYLSLPENGHTVWQHPTVAAAPLPPDVIEVVIRYDWKLTGDFCDYEAEAFGELPPTLDARIYAGLESVILEANDPPDETWWKRDRKRVRFWFHSLRFRVRDLGGLFIGRICRRSVENPKPILSDPGFLPRVKRYEARNPTGASCLELCNIAQDAVPDKLIVAVHGSWIRGYREYLSAPH